MYYVLRIGRKGEAGSTEKKDTMGNIKMALNTIKDLTRGPDNQDPVWVDTIKKIDFKKVGGTLAARRVRTFSRE